LFIEIKYENLSAPLGASSIEAVFWQVIQGHFNTFILVEEAIPMIRIKKLLSFGG